MNACPSILQRDVREDSLRWLLPAYVFLGSLVALLDETTAPPPSLTAMGMSILLLSGIAWLVRARNEPLAAWLLALGSLALVVLSWLWFPDIEAHSLLLLPIVVALVSLGAKAALATAAPAMAALAFVGLASGPTAGLWITAGFVCLATFCLLMAEQAWATMLTMLWQNYEQACQHLEEARDRQVQLKQALEDLDLANREVIRLNDLLIAAREAVEEARRAKEEFVANVSHELRTPLNMIIGFSDEILERPQFYADNLPADLLEDIASIRRNSAHLANLVDDVLDLVEADTGFTRLTKSWTSMVQIVQEAVESVGVFFAKKRIQLLVDVPGDLPPVYCDHVRIRQVVLNLLSNAARFTQEGHTRITAKQEGGQLIVQVTDTGPGMDAAMVQRVFEPFQQADPSIRRRYGGTGLGLTISKRFLEMHGGKIWIESEPGRGTTVSFALPIQPNDIPLTPRRWFSPYQEYAPRTQPSLLPKDMPAPRVVVCEQGEVLSNLIRHYLPELEVTTTRPKDLAALQTDTVAALVLNQMPDGHSPHKLLSALPRLAFDVPILSCWVPERHAAALQETGIQDYLVKPIQRADLLASIERVAPNARRILLVEDDVEARQLFNRMLATAANTYQIMPAAEGESALQLMREWQPELVLLDLIMPGQDGFAVLAAKSKDETIREIPVIVISAKDPQREPIMSDALLLTRQQGLSARDLILALRAIMTALPPRFGAPEPRETLVPSLASG